MGQEDKLHPSGEDILTETVIDASLYNAEQGKVELEISDIDNALNAVHSLVDTTTQRSLTFYLTNPQFLGKSNLTPELVFFEKKDEDEDEFEKELSATFRFGELELTVTNISGITCEKNSLGIRKDIDPDKQLWVRINSDGELSVSHSTTEDKLK